MPVSCAVDVRRADGYLCAQSRTNWQGVASQRAWEAIRGKVLFREHVDSALKKARIKLSAADRKQILKAVSWRVETALPVNFQAS